MNQEELERKFRIFEKQIMQIQEQLQAVDRAMMEMGQINLGLDEISGEKANGKEILAPIGRGIFVEAKLASEELMVDVGGANFIKKTIPETKEIIEEQIGKLGEMKNQLEGELEKINEEITESMSKVQGEKQD